MKSLARIWGATSFTGFRPPSRISSTRITWKPNWVRTGAGATWPCLSAKAASSNCETTWPLVIQPRSPPRAAVPGSSEDSFASFPKSSPALARRIRSAAFARALSSPSLPPVSGTRISTWAACTWCGVSNSARWPS